MEVLLKWIEDPENYKKFITVMVLAFLGLSVVADSIFEHFKKKE